MPTKAIHGITVAHFYETYRDKLQLELVTGDDPNSVAQRAALTKQLDETIKTALVARADEDEERMRTVLKDVDSPEGTPELLIMRSKSTFGLSLITLVFRDGVEIYWARQRVLERLLGNPEHLRGARAGRRADRRNRLHEHAVLRRGAAPHREQHHARRTDVRRRLDPAGRHAHDAHHHEHLRCRARAIQRRARRDDDQRRHELTRGIPLVLAARSLT